jgi:4'-phosphopantetheinyl transferase EntD
MMIEQVLPGMVGYAETFRDADAQRLFPAEEAAITRAVGKRRREFTTGRSCARAALGMLGFGPVPIGRGERGAPVWPAGVVGSITHCQGYRAAVVARTSDVATLGLDAEPNEALPEGVLAVISLPGERARISELAAAEPGVCWDRLLFCAKESVYKAWFPLTRRWLGFKDADITIQPAARTFTARLTGPADGGDVSFNGRWVVSDGLIIVVIVEPAPSPLTALAAGLVPG